MRYAATVPFNGDTATAFALAVQALKPLGFRLVTRDESLLELVGPGMNSTRQSAILGASRIQVTRSGEELILDAELGGVQQMSRFLNSFPIALYLVLGIMFFAEFSLIFHNLVFVMTAVLAVGGTGLLWLFLAPIMTRSIRGRTCRSIDALLNNMAVVGQTTY